MKVQPLFLHLPAKPFSFRFPPSKANFLRLYSMWCRKGQFISNSLCGLVVRAPIYLLTGKRAEPLAEIHPLPAGLPHEPPTFSTLQANVHLGSF